MRMYYCTKIVGCPITFVDIKHNERPLDFPWDAIDTRESLYLAPPCSTVPIHVLVVKLHVVKCQEYYTLQTCVN